MRKFPTISGPETATILERVVHLIPVPYPVAALMLGLIVGSPGYWVSIYLGGRGPAIQTDVYSVFFEALYVAVPVYAILGIRFMRSKLLAAEPRIESMVPEGEQSYHRLFGRVSSYLPQILLALALYPLAIFLNLPSMTSFPVVVFAVATGGFLTLMYGTLAWIYLSSIWGLYRLGKVQLRLAPYYEDRMLGLRPIGSLALSIAFVYFSAVGLVALLFSFSVLAESIILPFILAGVLLFFLPLNSVHEQMLTAKRKEEATLNSQLGRFAVARSYPDSSEQSSVAELKEITTNDILSRRLSIVSTWPFDTAMLGRFTAIILSVTAIILSKYVQIALHL